jgi:hypothetical protein
VTELDRTPYEDVDPDAVGTTTDNSPGDGDVVVIVSVLIGEYRASVVDSGLILVRHGMAEP